MACDRLCGCSSRGPAHSRRASVRLPPERTVIRILDEGRQAGGDIRNHIGGHRRGSSLKDPLTGRRHSPMMGRCPAEQSARGPQL